jgi:hypothetical protein
MATPPVPQIWKHPAPTLGGRVMWKTRRESGILRLQSHVSSGTPGVRGAVRAMRSLYARSNKAHRILLRDPSSSFVAVSDNLAELEQAWEWLQRIDLEGYTPFGPERWGFLTMFFAKLAHGEVMELAAAPGARGGGQAHSQAAGATTSAATTAAAAAGADNAANAAAPAAAGSPAAPSPQAAPSPAAAEVREDLLCCICLDREIDTVLLECGHSVVCSVCGVDASLDTCPICRAKVERIKRIFR